MLYKQALELLHKVAAPVAPTTYTIKRGDTFSALDKRYKLPMGSFQKANPSVVPTKMQIGQQLTIPNSPPQRVIPPEPRVPGVKYDTPPATKPAPKTYSDDEAFRLALYYAETGSFKNPYIRTLVQPKNPKHVNTAYGRGQITQLKAKDYFNRYPKQMASSKPFYDKVMSPMYRKFIQYSRTPGVKQRGGMWGYGGTGKPFTAEDKANYDLMMDNMLSIDKQRAIKMMPKEYTSDALLNKRIQLWRGVPRTSDPGYYNKVITKYNELLKARK
jgi:LysM repeat protein